VISLKRVPSWHGRQRPGRADAGCSCRRLGRDRPRPGRSAVAVYTSTSYFIAPAKLLMTVYITSSEFLATVELASTVYTISDNLIESSELVILYRLVLIIL
jgi:hypothetical protein